VPPPAATAPAAAPRQAAWILGLDRYFAVLRPSRGDRAARIVQGVTLAVLVSVFITAASGGPDWNKTDRELVEALMERIYDGDMSALPELEDLDDAALGPLRMAMMVMASVDADSQQQRLVRAAIRRIESR